MSIRVNFFGVLAEVTGQTQLVIPQAKDLNSLKEELYSLYPQLNNYSFRVCIEKKVIDTNETLADGNTVSFLPPFSGG